MSDRQEKLSILQTLTVFNLKEICNVYLIDKLLGKIRDGRDDFLNKRVAIRCRDESSLILEVGGHRVMINNLGKENFSYLCNDKCVDYLYQVKKGSTPFCKHYAAAIAQFKKIGADTYFFLTSLLQKPIIYIC